MKFTTFQQEEDAAVQMAPLIDCVFNLLIFFLVTSMLQKPHNELAIQIPDSGVGEEATKTKEPEPVVILVTASNPEPKAPKSGAPQFEPFIVLDKEPMTKELLERRLRQIAQETPNRRIRIDSDGHLKWRHVVPVLDLCRFHGLTRVDIRVP